MNNTFYEYPELGLTLDLGKIKLHSDKKQKEHALSAMQALEKGEIANPDENRMVGHYWLRSPELAPNSKISNEIKNTVNEIKIFCSDILSGKIKSQTGENFSDVLFIGIGGSALGPQLLVDCLSENKIIFHFFDNTDPDGFNRIFNKINISKTLVVVVSKSGGTTETRNGMLETKALFEKKSLNLEKHCVAISCKDSALEKLALEKDWLKIFHIWDWVGGRTSIFSAVGLLPLGLIGGDIDGFLLGAKSMDTITRSSDSNPALLLAQSWLSEKNKNMVVLPYFDRLLLFSRYLQQLVMESLGKEKNLSGEVVNEGLSVFGNKGSTDQHAFVQQLRDGKKDFFVIFLNILSAPSGELELESGIRSRDHLFGFYLGTRKALSDAGRSSISISFKNFDARSFGALLALFERSVGFYASMLGINAYNQPGVEAGKKAAQSFIELKKELIKIFSSTKELQTAKSIHEKLIQYEQDEILYLLKFMSANGEILEKNQGFCAN